jgi:hypothetical protein
MPGEYALMLRVLVMGRLEKADDGRGRGGYLVSDN